MLSNEIFHIMKESNIERFTFKGDSITLIQSGIPEFAILLSVVSPIAVGLILAFINTIFIVPFSFQIGVLISILVCLIALFFPFYRVTYEVTLDSPMTSKDASFIKRVGMSDYHKEILNESLFTRLSKSERSNFISSLKEEIRKRNEVQEEILDIKDFLSNIKMKIKAEKEVSEAN